MGKSRNDKFTDVETKASIESGFPLLLNGEVYTSTVRTTTCDILIRGAKCDSCHDYRAQLCTMYSRYKKNKRSKSRYVNNRFLTPPLKDEKLQQLQERVSVANKEIKRLNTKLEELLRNCSRHRFT